MTYPMNSSSRVPCRLKGGPTNTAMKATPMTTPENAAGILVTVLMLWLIVRLRRRPEKTMTAAMSITTVAPTAPNRTLLRKASPIVEVSDAS
jgi:hypothetical protein